MYSLNKAILVGAAMLALAPHAFAADDAKLDQASLPRIKMPNRDGFVPDPAFDPATLFKKK